MIESITNIGRLINCLYDVAEIRERFSRDALTAYVSLLRKDGKLPELDSDDDIAKTAESIHDYILSHPEEFPAPCKECKSGIPIKLHYVLRERPDHLGQLTRWYQDVDTGFNPDWYLYGQFYVLKKEWLTTLKQAALTVAVLYYDSNILEPNGLFTDDGRLAKRCGVSRNTYLKHVELLTAYGMLETSRRWGKLFVQNVVTVPSKHKAAVKAYQAKPGNGLAIPQTVIENGWSYAECVVFSQLIEWCRFNKKQCNVSVGYVGPEQMEKFATYTGRKTRQINNVLCGLVSDGYFHEKTISKQRFFTPTGRGIG